ncbi:MAG: AraC family transcriptional regulator [Pseudomonadales bacterium]|nr:AraC family transcriptional regulator [Pseudomonadales bacterium]
MNQFIRGFFLLAALLLSGAVFADDDAGKADSVESELAALNAELMLVEEDLLYPASSRVAVYLALDVGTFFRLDAVTLKLNGEDVTHYLYTTRQVEALSRGGVQRLYVGNARQGSNELTAFFTGIGPHDRPYKRATSVKFEQSFEPVAVELTISDDTATQQPEFVAVVR